MHALPTRSHGFVASLQSTTPAVLSSARPPRDPETAFIDVDGDRDRSSNGDVAKWVD